MKNVRRLLLRLNRKKVLTSSPLLYSQNPKRRKTFILDVKINADTANSSSAKQLLCAVLLCVSETLSLLEGVDSNGIVHFLINLFCEFRNK